MCNCQASSFSVPYKLSFDQEGLTLAVTLPMELKSESGEICLGKIGILNNSKFGFGFESATRIYTKALFYLYTRNWRKDWNMVL